MKDLPNHYEKLEELGWKYGKDFPMPEGIVHTRQPFEQFMKFQKLFEEKRYGIGIVAVDGDKYVGSTDIHVFPKSDPHKAWTGSLGVLREYRRQGIATALKVKAFDKLKEKGIKQVRTDNEENNPMYKINVNLGFFVLLDCCCFLIVVTYLPLTFFLVFFHKCAIKLILPKTKPS